METAECPCCHRRFQGRHPDQTSDALGAASNTDKTITVYVIDLSRGHEVIESVLGDDFKGPLSSGGFVAYDPVAAWAKQQCNAHFLKGCSQIEAIKSRGAVPFSRQGASVLRAGINLHRRRVKLTPHGFKVQRGKIEAALDRLLDKNLTDPGNARLALRLKKHRNHIFTYSL